MASTRVAVVGATGYTGEELLRLLLHHPAIQLTYLAASAKWERPTPVSDVFPRFTGQLDLPIEPVDPARLLKASDAVFLALPHGEAMKLAPALVDAGKLVVDLSGDFRLRAPGLYPQWYHLEHAAPSWLTDARVAYGLSEWCRDAIAKARLVANPGCYATSILLAILPLFQAGLIEQDAFIVDAKSGLSGAGRKAETPLLFGEMSQNLRAYKVNQHQHMPEVLQGIEQLTGRHGRMTFVPQVIPVHRGMLSMIYLRTGSALKDVMAAYARAYPAGRAPFVRVREGSLPQLRDVVETNRCDIGIMHDGSGQLIIASALDNLTKGASGQAVQNLNLMLGVPETAGLL
ncbi:MAG: N-acetyl-gamma-glutamyl-phosphate reductase [Candidatus Omnitrophica bacterium]|nr:N-acetyl-gamma-glutamyl-phosphate reductase [Candidatus Omnitrophota bacterium]